MNRRILVFFVVCFVLLQFTTLGLVLLPQYVGAGVIHVFGQTHPLASFWFHVLWYGQMTLTFAFAGALSFQVELVRKKLVWVVFFSALTCFLSGLRYLFFGPGNVYTNLLPNSIAVVAISIWVIYHLPKLIEKRKLPYPFIRIESNRRGFSTWNPSTTGRFPVPMLLPVETQFHFRIQYPAGMMIQCRFTLVAAVVEVMNRISEKIATYDNPHPTILRIVEKPGVGYKFTLTLIDDGQMNVPLAFVEALKRTIKTGEGSLLLSDKELVVELVR